MTAAKLRRWIDLLAALLRRRYSATFEELSGEVPAYLLKPDADARRRSAVFRMFERDKDELRAFGIPIITVTDSDGQAVGYQLNTRDFYLPYLALITQVGRTTPRRVDRYGYRSLPVVAFDADELTAIAEAVRRLEALDNRLLTADARSASRKLAIDLPLDVLTRPDRITMLRAGPKSDEMFATLSQAVLAKKRVQLEYHSRSSGSTTTREVEPYGLFFLGSHWYLAGRDSAAGEIRNFRLSRIATVQPNRARPQSPDFTVPDTFRLRRHATSKAAWDLGDADLIEAIVDFRGDTGALLSAKALGNEIPEHPTRRSFKVRRADAFVRWLLSFGGAAVPLSPDNVVGQYRQMVRDTAAMYGSDR